MNLSVLFRLREVGKSHEKDSKIFLRLISLIVFQIGLIDIFDLVSNTLHAILVNDSSIVRSIG